MPGAYRRNKRRKNENWRGWFIPSHGARRVEFTGTCDKSETGKIALEIEQLLQAGQPLPAPIHVYLPPKWKAKIACLPGTADQQPTLPLEQPLEEFLEQYLSLQGRRGGRNGHPWSKVHRRNRESQLRFWFKEARLKTLKDISSCLLAVEEAASNLAEKTQKTQANYLESIMAFCHWLHERELIPKNPLKGMNKGRRHPTSERRALTDDEFETLRSVATPEQELVLLVAVLTGLRRGELEALRVRNFDQEGPGLLLEAQWTKNRRDGQQALPEILSTRLTEEVAGKGPEEKLLSGTDHAYRWFNDLLKKAGIPKRTSDGVLVFHSLRATCLTRAAQQGTSASELGKLARISTPGILEDHYLKASHGRQREIVEQLAEGFEDQSTMSPELKKWLDGKPKSSPIGLVEIIMRDQASRRAKKKPTRRSGPEV